MVTFGFSPNYVDPYSGAVLNIAGGTGEGGGGERDVTQGAVPALEGMPGAAPPEAVRQDLLNTTDTTTTRRPFSTEGVPFNSNDPTGMAQIALQNANTIFGRTNLGQGAGQGATNTATLAGNYGTGELSGPPTGVGGPNWFTRLGEPGTGGWLNTPAAGGGPTPTLSDMAGTPAGPQALATGPGWYISNDGQFHSDNEGANIRANRLNAGQGYSIGPGTIIDQGPPRSPIGAPNALSGDLGPGMAYARDITGAGRQLPAGLGMQTAAPPFLADMAGIPGLQVGEGFATNRQNGLVQSPLQSLVSGGGGGAAAALAGAPGYANYNPRLNTSVAQTYGDGTQGAGGATTQGAQGLPAGFQRQGNSRIVTGPDGTQYVTDASGYLNPNADQARAWQSRQNIDVNAVTGFAPDAIEKMRYLDSVGLSTPEEKRFLQTIGTGTDFANTQSYSDWVGRHNAEAQRLGFSAQQMQAPSRIIPMDQAFPVYKEYGDLLKQLGATNINIRPDNHTLYSIGSDTPIMQWRSANGNPMALSGDTPIANVLDDLAKLRTIAANQQQAAAAAAAAGGGGGGGYGGSRYGGGYGGGNAAAAAAADTAPWYSGTPGGRLWANNPEMLANYANSPSYDAINIAQIAGGGIQTGYPSGVPAGTTFGTATPWGATAFDPTGGISGIPIAPGMPYFDPSGAVTSGYAPVPGYQPANAGGAGYGAAGGVDMSGGPVNGYRIPTQYELGPAPLDQPFNWSGVGNAAGAAGDWLTAGGGGTVPYTSAGGRLGWTDRNGVFHPR